MPLTIKEAARRFQISEEKIRSFILSGELPVERRGRQILISELDLQPLIDDAQQIAGDPIVDALASQLESFREDLLKRLEDRLSALQQALDDLRKTQAERESFQELRRRMDRDLVEKDLELERLKRDLVYQQRLHEKELADQGVVFQEKWAVLEREAAERVRRERERTEQAVEEERRLWSERLAHQEQRFADRLAEMQDREGFWSRLMKMITWS